MRKVDKPSPLQNLLLQPKRFPSSKNISTNNTFSSKVIQPFVLRFCFKYVVCLSRFPAPPRPASQASSAAIAAVVVTNQKVPFLSNHLKTSTTLYVSAYVSSRGKTFVHKHLTMFSHWAASPVPNTKDNRLPHWAELITSSQCKGTFFNKTTSLQRTKRLRYLPVVYTCNCSLYRSANVLPRSPKACSITRSVQWY